MSNHLGNVLVTISDRKKSIADPLNAALIKFFEPIMLSGTDYYPFGMPMRVGGDSSYRYGFNGKENDNEVKGGDGLQQDYGMRVYDLRIAKFLSRDPLSYDYPELTPYQFASNRPIAAIDLDGMEAKDLFRELEPVRAQRKYEQEHGITYPESKGERYVRYFVTGGLGAFTGILLLPIATTTAGGVMNIILSSSYAASGALVTVATWASNPSNWQAASTTAGFAFEILNPDPNGFAIDFPGNGDEFGRAVKWLFKTRAGKTVEFAAEKGAKYADMSEFHWAGKLLDEGKNVTLLKESTEKGVRTADFLVNGVKTELKTISDIKKTDADNLSSGIARVIKESSGQATSLIIDLTKQAGAEVK